MDEVAARIAAFRSYNGPSGTAWKLDTLLDLCKLRDSRVVTFLGTVLADSAESIEVRLDVLSRLRASDVSPGGREQIANSMLALLSTEVDARLRLHATSALGDFADLPHVVGPLAELVLSRGESFELRYAAFASIERAGPTPEVTSVLGQLTSDELLGRAAASMLQTWQLS